MQVSYTWNNKEAAPNIDILVNVLRLVCDASMQKVTHSTEELWQSWNDKQKKNGMNGTKLQAKQAEV